MVASDALKRAAWLGARSPPARRHVDRCTVTGTQQRAVTIVSIALDVPLVRCQFDRTNSYAARPANTHSLASQTSRERKGHQSVGATRDASRSAVRLGSPSLSIRIAPPSIGVFRLHFAFFLAPWLGASAAAGRSSLGVDSPSGVRATRDQFESRCIPRRRCRRAIGTSRPR